MLATFIAPPLCADHQPPTLHPECAARLHAITDHLLAQGVDGLLQWRDASEACDESILRVHSRDYLARIEAHLPPPHGDAVLLDGETHLSQGSLRAARAAAGAVISAIDAIDQGTSDVVFCAVRPPGHHATADAAMGFCLFNNIAIGAYHALAQGFERVAIVDFDIHHGNGTQDMVSGDSRILFCSSFEHPLYPNTPVDQVASNIINTKLAPICRSAEFRAAINRDWWPALVQFKPQLILISAGFDGFIDDEMSHVGLVEQDYQWLGAQLRHYWQSSQTLPEAERCRGLVASLEGGYDLASLGRCVLAHLRGLAAL